MDTKTKQEAIAGAPGVIRLGDRDYAVKPASLADLVAMRKRIKAKVPGPDEAFGQLVRSPIWEHLSTEDKGRLAKEAADKKIRGESALSEETIFELLSELDHCRAFALMLLRPLNAGCKIEAVIEQQITAENAAHVAYQLLEQSGGLHLGNARS